MNIKWVLILTYIGDIQYPISMQKYDTSELEIDARLAMITKGLRNEILNGLKNISNIKDLQIGSCCFVNHLCSWC